jgi:hypothetical protein
MTLSQKYALARQALESACAALVDDPQGAETWRELCSVRARCAALAKCGA